MCQGQQPGSGPFGSSAGSSGGMNYSGQRTMAPNYPGAQNYAQYRLGMMPSFTPGAPGAFGRSGSQPTNTPGDQGGGGYPGGAGYPTPPTLNPNGGTGGGSPMETGDPAAQMGGRFGSINGSGGILNLPSDPAGGMPQPDPNSGTGDYMTPRGDPASAFGMNKPAMEQGRQFRGWQSPPWMQRQQQPPMQPQQQSMQQMAMNYANVAGFQMPGAMQQPRDMQGSAALAPAQQGMTPQQWQTQNASMIRPGTVQDPATMAGSAPKPTPPMPQGQMQPGQSDWQYNAGFQNGSPGTGWVPGYFPSEQQYISNNMPNFSQQQLGQLNYQDLINSIGQVSGNPYNQSIYGPRR